MLASTSSFKDSKLSLHILQSNLFPL